MAAGIPVLSLVPDELSLEFDKHWGYYSSGAVNHFPLGDDPSLCIYELIYNENSRIDIISKGFDYFESNCGKRDGKNKKRFVDIVKLYC
jgi:hypothetical protein